MRTARMLAMTVAWAGSLQSEPVSVKIYDQAQTTREEVQAAAEVIRRVLRDAEVPVTVEVCTFGGCAPAEPETTITVRILPGFRGAALGATRLGPRRGGYIDVMKGAADSFSRPKAPDRSVLGYIVAHEIGHLLLGSPRHAATGVMKGRWGYMDSWLMANNALRFNPKEAKKMRERVDAAEVRRGN